MRIHPVWFNRWLALWLVGACLAGQTVAGSGTPALAAKDDPKQELKELNKLIEKKRKQEKTAAKKEQSVLGQLEQLDYRIHLSRQKIALIDKQIRGQQQRLAELKRELSETERNADQLQDALGDRMRAIYMSGGYGEWQLLLGAQNGQELMYRLDALQRIAEHETDLMQRYREQQTQLASQRHEQEVLLDELEENRQQLSGTLKDVNGTKAKKRTLLASIRSERKLASKAIEELEQSANALQALLKRLEQEEAARNSRGRLATMKGKLPWPGDGAVIGKFGQQRHPLYNTNIYRRGIEIKSQRGAPVRAVHQAVVAYADWFKGYGLVVVLDHGDHYYTLYAHLSEALVNVGQAVEQGDVIGEVGETGLGDEQTLYFELRHHGAPVDPIAWLKKRK